MASKHVTRKAPPVERPVPDFDRPYSEWTHADKVALWDARRVLVCANDFHGVTITQAADSFAEFMREASDLIDAGRIDVVKERSYMTDMARSSLAWRATRPEHRYTHMFMWDTDMTMSLDDLTRLLARNVDVISGTYFMRGVKTREGRDPHPFPCVATRDGEYITRAEIASASEAGMLVPVHNVGGGSLLVSIAALEAVGQPAFTFNWQIFGSSRFYEGEDTTFCHRLHRNKIPIFMDPDVRPDHFAVVRSGYNLCDLNGHDLYTPGY